MRVYVVPIDCLLQPQTLKRVCYDVHRGLDFAGITLELLDSITYLGRTSRPAYSASYRAFLRKEYPAQTIGILSNPFRSSRKEKEALVGESWSDSLQGIAKCARDYGRCERNRDLAQTVIHEILHWAQIDHHSTKKNTRCLMLPYSLPRPLDISLVPCDSCRTTFTTKIKQLYETKP